MATISETDILEQVVSPGNGGMSPDAARALLQFKFDKDAVKRIRELLRRNNRGAISAEERLLLEKYLRVGRFVDLIHAKARRSLEEAGRSS